MEKFTSLICFQFMIMAKMAMWISIKKLLTLSPDASKPTQIEQLALSMHHVAMKQADDDEHFSNAVPSFRGEVRKNDDFQFIEEGDTFSSPLFLSTSDVQEVAESFLNAKETLKQGEINVLYTIEEITPYSGIFISEIMNDKEN
ncbi:MAG: hypothetical protein ACMZI0_06770 [Symbiopectobacterium sp.]|uniref:hypothetical protein n=1 Tax=Symbiopectobacterium sp. TaxID=2952789 RepID=UPI0039EC1736